jgi:hypothetical protein
MLGQTAKIALVAAILAFAAPQAKAAGPPAEGPLDRGIVVLRNGEIIQGRISHAEGVYVVDLPDAQIRLKDADVELVCGSLDEAYRRKRAAIRVGNVHDHLALAQWCLRHELLGPATVELADATTADPKNPMIAALRRRLEMAAEPPPPRDAKKSATPGPSNDDLDRMVRGLPRGAVETFTQSVQPVLMNHCTGSGCHGLQADAGMKLIRISAGKSASRRFTQRNLHSVLQYVDRGNPVSSKLLAAAGGPHGPVQHAIFSEREAAQYKRLVDWVGQIAGREIAEAPASVAPAMPAAAEEPGDSEPPPPRVLPKESRKARPMPPTGRGPREQRAGGRPPGNDSRKKPPPDAAPAAPDPAAADPLDPEVFNRRYGAKKP